jgi:hypothetical protein
MKPKTIPPLPLKEIPYPWSEVMRSLDEPLPISPLLLPAIQRHLQLAGGDWRLHLYWLVKQEWNPKLKIPISRKYARLHEPRGKLLYRTLNLCIACYDSLHPKTQYYPNDSDWFRQVAQEVRTLDNQEIQANIAIGKKDLVKHMYGIIKDLKNLKNPATPDTSLHFYRLMEVALSLENQDEFHKTYWKPFLSAVSGWIQALDGPNCHECYVEGNKIVCRVGQGKGKRTLLIVP